MITELIFSIYFLKNSLSCSQIPLNNKINQEHNADWICDNYSVGWGGQLAVYKL